MKRAYATAGPIQLAYGIPALTLAGAVAAVNAVNSVRRGHPANSLFRHWTPESDEPLNKFGRYCSAAYYGGALGIIKGVGYGAVWPVTLCQAHYLYQRDGHIHDMVFPDYEWSDMAKEEEDRRLREAARTTNNSNNGQ